MSGAERRRAKKERRLAQLAIRDFGGFSSEIDRRILGLLRQADRRGQDLLESEPGRPTSGDLEALAAGVESELIAVAELLESVFVRRSVEPSRLGFTPNEMHENRRRAAEIVRRLRSALGGSSPRREIADAAARSISLAFDLPFHRLVSVGYHRGRPAPTKTLATGPRAA